MALKIKVNPILHHIILQQYTVCHKVWFLLASSSHSISLKTKHWSLHVKSCSTSRVKLSTCLLITHTHNQDILLIFTEQNACSTTKKADDK